MDIKNISRLILYMLTFIFGAFCIITRFIPLTFDITFVVILTIIICLFVPFHTYLIEHGYFYTGKYVNVIPALLFKVSIPIISYFSASTNMTYRLLWFSFLVCLFDSIATILFKNEKFVEMINKINEINRAKVYSIAVVILVVIDGYFYIFA